MKGSINFAIVFSTEDVNSSVVHKPVKPKCLYKGTNRITGLSGRV
jgi:hypothetical protein